MKDCCWILSDGTVGMEVQCIALAEALNFKYQIKAISPSVLLRALPQLGSIPGLSGVKSLNKKFCPPFPRASITCGRRHAGAAIALKKVSQGQVVTIHIQDPRIDPKFFDYLVVPDHDPARGNNILTSKGSLTNINKKKLAEEAKRFLNMVNHLPHPRIAVNIGGGSKRSTIDLASAENIVSKLKLFTQKNECSLMITTSRRTDKTLKSQLRKLSKSQNILLSEGNDPNPYTGFLGLAEAIIVTSDSINMVSEACSTGKPVYILPMGMNNKRRQSFLETMEKEGRAKPFDGNLESWTYEPLNETERIATIIKEKLAAN